MNRRDLLAHTSLLALIGAAWAVRSAVPDHTHATVPTETRIRGDELGLCIVCLLEEQGADDPLTAIGGIKD